MSRLLQLRAVVTQIVHPIILIQSLPVTSCVVPRDRVCYRHELRSVIVISAEVGVYVSAKLHSSSSILLLSSSCSSTAMLTYDTMHVDGLIHDQAFADVHANTMRETMLTSARTLPYRGNRPVTYQDMSILPTWASSSPVTHRPFGHDDQLLSAVADHERQRQQHNHYVSRSESAHGHPDQPIYPPDSNAALMDYQMQLMLLEQQNKKRLLMARREQGSGLADHGTPVNLDLPIRPHECVTPPPLRNDTSDERTIREAQEMEGAEHKRQTEQLTASLTLFGLPTSRDGSSPRPDFNPNSERNMAMIAMLMDQQDMMIQQDRMIQLARARDEHRAPTHDATLPGFGVGIEHPDQGRAQVIRRMRESMELMGAAFEDFERQFRAAGCRSGDVLGSLKKYQDALNDLVEQNRIFDLQFGGDLGYQVGDSGGK